MEQKLRNFTIEAWSKFRYLYRDLGAIMPRVYFNNRLKTTAGYCYHEKREIQISRELFEEHTEEFRKIIIPHECAHQVAFDLHKVDCGHGPKWKEIMVKYGIPPDRLHNLTNTKHAARRAKVKT
jgi:SprT protein